MGVDDGSLGGGVSEYWAVQRSDAVDTAVRALVVAGYVVGIIWSSSSLTSAVARVEFAVVAVLATAVYVMVGFLRRRQIERAIRRTGVQPDLGWVQATIALIMMGGAPLLSYLVPAAWGADLGPLPFFWWMLGMFSLGLGVKLGRLTPFGSGSAVPPIAQVNGSGTGDHLNQQEPGTGRRFRRSGYYAAQGWIALVTAIVLGPAAVYVTDSVPWATVLTVIGLALIVSGVGRIRAYAEVSPSGVRLVQLRTRRYPRVEIVGFVPIRARDWLTNGHGSVLTLVTTDGKQVSVPFLRYPGGPDSPYARQQAQSLSDALAGTS